MRAKLLVHESLEDSVKTHSSPFHSGVGPEAANGASFGRKSVLDARHSLHLVREQLSPWSQSWRKRVFDCVSVLAALPFLVPVLLAVALTVKLTSPGRILFLQMRMGLRGRIFTILKFRTMVDADGSVRNAVTTTDNQVFTPIGCFLRKWKLDELPQLLNVLWGDMSLVGPRPKLPEHQIAVLKCRPGITGGATIAFAREEIALGCVPEEQLRAYYHTVVLPAKHQLDAEYMARATFLSDIALLVDSVLRRWDYSFLSRLLDSNEFEAEARMDRPKVLFPGKAAALVQLITSDASPVGDE